MVIPPRTVILAYSTIAQSNDAQSNGIYKLMNKNIDVTGIAKIAIEIATVKGSIVRTKAFAAGFERIETNWGKGALDADTKASLRREIDKQIKEIFTLRKAEVVVRGSDYEQVNTHGEYETGRKVTTLDNAPKEDSEILLGMVRVLNAHRLKVSKKEDGASEGDIRKERRIRNAILGLVEDMRKAGDTKSPAFESTVKYMFSLPANRAEQARVEEIAPASNASETVNA